MNINENILRPDVWESSRRRHVVWNMLMQIILKLQIWNIYRTFFFLFFFFQKTLCFLNQSFEIYIYYLKSPWSTEPSGKSENWYWGYHIGMFRVRMASLWCGKSSCSHTLGGRFSLNCIVVCGEDSPFHCGMLSSISDTLFPLVTTKHVFRYC